MMDEKKYKKRIIGYFLLISFESQIMDVVRLIWDGLSDCFLFYVLTQSFIHSIRLWNLDIIQYIY